MKCGNERYVKAAKPTSAKQPSTPETPLSANSISLCSRTIRILCRCRTVFPLRAGPAISGSNSRTSFTLLAGPTCCQNTLFIYKYRHHSLLPFDSQPRNIKNKNTIREPSSFTDKNIGTDMASKDVKVEEAADIASYDERDTRPCSVENGPLPTDSMVTVRLSDSSSLQPLDTSTPENAFLPKSSRNTFEGFRSVILDGSAAVSRQDESAVDDTSEVVHISEGYRASTMSITSIQEEDSLVSAASTIRSRSDSSGTLSSNGSAQVDWDELEKSEEQAPRDEGSDEVGIIHSEQLNYHLTII